MIVKAKRLGWNETLSDEQLWDLDPYEYDSDDIEGEHEEIHATLPNGTELTVHLVGGQEADPATIMEVDAKLELSTSNKFCATGLGGGVDPTCTDDEGGAGLIGRALGAAGDVEHTIMEVVGKGFAKLPGPVQKVVSGTLRVAFAPFTAGQALAERVHKERGYTNEQAAKLRGTLATIDLIAFKAAKGASLAGVPGARVATAVSGIVPVASAAYLLYSSARDLPATYRAAKGAVKDAVAKVRAKMGSGKTPKSGYKPRLEQIGNVANAEEAWETVVTDDQAEMLADALEAHDFDDWYFALLTASLEELDGDVAAAIEAAAEAYRNNPKAPE